MPNSVTGLSKYKVELSDVVRNDVAQGKFSLRRVGIALMVFCFGVTAQAQSIKPHPHVTTVQQQVLELDDYRLALGAVKKIDGVWTAKEERVLAGQLQRHTVEIGKSATAPEVFDYYLTQLREQGWRELFRCQGRDCGSSNTWANERFEVRELYGLDQFQWYAVFERPGVENGSSFAVVYAVTRGNRRSYLLLDQLSTAPVDGAQSQSVIKPAVDLGSGRSYPLPAGLQGQQLLVDQEQLQALAAALKGATQAFYVVGHDYGSGPLEQQQQRARALAEAVKQSLVGLGASAERLEVQAVGSLAPGNVGAVNRIEVVVKAQ